MTEMFDVLPLSPVREWAISRSFIASVPVLTFVSYRGTFVYEYQNPPHYSSCQELDLRPRQFARQQNGCDRDHVTRRFECTASASRTVGIKRFDFVADPDRLAQIFGAASHAHAHFVRFTGMCGDLRAVQRIHPDQIEPQFACRDARQPEPLANNFKREMAARQCAGTGIGDLALADKAVDITD